MHSYQRRWADGPAGTLPKLAVFHFGSALDVVRWAELDPVLTWRTYPDVWHLDEAGAYRCGSRGSSLDSVRTFAADPDAMLECRLVELDEPCSDRWLVIEPRHEWMDPYRVDEGDAQAFLTLRKGLARYGGAMQIAMLIAWRSW